MLKDARAFRIAMAAGLLAALLGFATPANAGYLNLTIAGSGGEINGATFIQGATLSGTGVFPAFVQIDGSGPGSVKEGYNTTVNNISNNGSSNTFNHEIRVSDLPILSVGGTSYYSFFLDINESNNASDKYLSLDELQVITSTTANQSSEPLPAGTTRYNMNSPGPGNGILLNFDLEPGSGRADMEFLVPVANFAGALATDFVYLYSKFGVLGVLGAGNPHGAPVGNYGTSDGFEEWALGRAGFIAAIPEPSSVILCLAALGGLGGFTHWRRRRVA